MKARIFRNTWSRLLVECLKLFSCPKAGDMEVSDPANFNDAAHRTASASVLIQKGIYHVFVLIHDTNADVFAAVLRMYQCLYQLCSAMLLLDTCYKGMLRNLPGPLKPLCSDPKNPTRKEIDPAMLLTHKIFESGIWKGFPSNHPLHASSVRAVQLYKRVVDARHIAIYRPMLLARKGWYWEDCSLIDRVKNLPRPTEVERVYKDFCAALSTEFSHQWDEQLRRAAKMNAAKMSDVDPVGGRDLWAVRLFREILQEYKDNNGERPTETIILSYGRLFHGNGATFLAEVAAFQDVLLNLKNIRCQLGVPPNNL